MNNNPDVGKTYNNTPEEPHTRKIAEIMQQLEDGINGLYSSEKYRAYLDTMAKFPHYSVNNQILIGMQRPDATRVASYSTWEKLGRHVIKGEHGMSIIAPNNGKKTVEIEVKGPDGQVVLDPIGKPVVEKKEVEYRGFHVAKVFDISQTEGKPLPELVTDLVDPVEGYDDYLDAIKSISPVPIRFGQIDSGAKGYYSARKQEIVVQRGMSEEQTIKTAVHEVAHARLGHGGPGDTTDRQTKEIQAESVAYVTCKALGLDTGEYSFGYIAGWSEGRDIKELRATLQTIRDQADAMIYGIEKQLRMTLEMRQEQPVVAQESQQIRISMG